MQMHGMNGSQLLGEVLHRHPNTLRFIRADLADHQAVMKCVGTAHQYLVKPCDAETVVQVLQRAFSLDTWLPGEAVHKIIGQLRRLPSPPQVYFKVVEALQSPEVNLEMIGHQIQDDPAMTAKLLQLVNSAVFGLQLQVSSPTEAVLYLGMETTKSVILLAHTFSYFDKISPRVLSVSKLWEHSIRVSRVAQAIAEAENASEDVCLQAFTAGMLHDAGKLALVANMPEEFMRAVNMAQERGVELWEAEKEVFGASHAEIGGCLLGIWGLPVPIVEAVALHHHPSQLVSKGFSSLSAVHAANVLCHQRETTIKGLPLPRLEEAYFSSINLSSRLPEWEQLAVAGEMTE
jgi:HD-like signal output (HDOD) protein